MNEKSGGKVIKAVIIALIAFFVIMQLYRAFYSPVTTGSVVHYSTYNGIDVNVVAVRDEKVLTTSDSGVISYNISDGEKIQNGGSVANMYATEADANTNSEIKSLKKTIADLKEVNGYNNSEAVDIDALDEKIDTALTLLIDEAASGTINGTNSANDLLKLINRRQIATGVSDGFSDALKSYETKLEELKAAKQNSTSKIKSKASGYFSSTVDGFETVLKSKDISSLTPQKLAESKAESKDYGGKVVGKIVSDYEWYLAAEISIDDSLKFKKDDSFIIRTNFESIPELPVKVKYVNKGQSGDKAVVVFSCTYMNSDLATMRKKEMTVVLETYNGLQVSSKAIRFVDGKKGVYVVSGSVLSFVPVNVLYATDNYCICKSETTGVRLKLYDEVIIKGKNLYDGKVID